MTKERELLFKITDAFSGRTLKSEEAEKWLRDYAAESSPVISDKGYTEGDLRKAFIAGGKWAQGRSDKNFNDFLSIFIM